MLNNIGDIPIGKVAQDQKLNRIKVEDLDIPWEIMNDLKAKNAKEPAPPQADNIVKPINEMKEIRRDKMQKGFGIIGGTPGNLSLGNFDFDPTKSIVVSTDGQIQLAKDINCLDDRYQFAFANRIGYYIIIPKKSTDAQILLAQKGQGGYPYTIPKFYNAEFQLKEFAGKELNFEFVNKYKDLLKYTIGLEFEASAGYLPQEKCFQLGLIPLRDGSITSVEYATIILDKNKLGLVQEQVKQLATYTEFDKECSLHMHLGGFPENPKHILAVYKVCKSLEANLMKILPKYSFSTAMYKRSRKDYCKLLPVLNSFNELYYWCSDFQANYMGSTAFAHPNDENKRGKWNIQSRYYWCNFVNMLFYDSCKTIEFRMLRPTYNFNRILFWIYTFNAILLYSEELAESSKTLHILESKPIENLTLEQLFSKVYPKDLAESMSDHVDAEKYVTLCQAQLGDFIGKNTQFEELLYKTPITNKLI